MRTCIPGTTLPLPADRTVSAFSVLEPVFAVSGGGLSLSQITEMTGLSATTIQNWVKRGWVSKPVNKKYGELQVARILLINLLRPAMQLERIAALLAYINGSVDSRADDIIPEMALYNMVCAAILEMESLRELRHESVIALIGAQLEGYEGPVPDAKERLTDALTVMLLNCAAATLMQQADAIYRRVVPAPKREAPQAAGAAPARIVSI